MASEAPARLEAAGRRDPAPVVTSDPSFRPHSDARRVPADSDGCRARRPARRGGLARRRPRLPRRPARCAAAAVMAQFRGRGCAQPGGRQDAAPAARARARGVAVGAPARGLPEHCILHRCAWGARLLRGCAHNPTIKLFHPAVCHGACRRLQLSGVTASARPLLKVQF